MNEREQALAIAEKWLNFDMNPLTQMVPGDPDCDALVLARQYVRTTEREQARVSAILDAVEALERNSTSAPVIERLKAVVRT